MVGESGRWGGWMEWRETNKSKRHRRDPRATADGNEASAGGGGYSPGEGCTVCSQMLRLAACPFLIVYLWACQQAHMRP